MPDPTFAPPPAAGSGAASAEPQIVEHPRPPRVGDLSLGWRTATAIAWAATILALAAVWNAGVQLGLPPWWLGPRSAPQPRVVQFVPFVAPVLMLLAAVNQVVWLPRLGLAAAAVVGAIGAVDLGGMTSLAIVQLVVAAAIAVFSLASFSGLYRRTTGDG